MWGDMDADEKAWRQKEMQAAKAEMVADREEAEAKAAEALYDKEELEAIQAEAEFKREQQEARLPHSTPPPPPLPLRLPALPLQADGGAGVFGPGQRAGGRGDRAGEERREGGRRGHRDRGEGGGGGDDRGAGGVDRDRGGGHRADGLREGEGGGGARDGQRREGARRRAARGVRSAHRPPPASPTLRWRPTLSVVCADLKDAETDLEVAKATNDTSAVRPPCAVGFVCCGASGRGVLESGGRALLFAGRSRPRRARRL
eukprot:SAG11_NODE_1955_length_4005_cov_2.390937_5_plen_259_part_00